MAPNAASMLLDSFAQQSCPGPEDEVFIIYVFPLPSDPECYEGVVPLPTEASDDRVAKVAGPILAKTLEVLDGFEGRVDEVVLLGNPAKEIVEFAMNLGVDLIVAGTRRSLAGTRKSTWAAFPVP